VVLKAAMDLRKWFSRRVSDLQPELANCGEPSSQNFVCRKEDDASRSGLIVDDLTSGKTKVCENLTLLPDDFHCSKNLIQTLGIASYQCSVLLFISKFLVFTT